MVPWRLRLFEPDSYSTHEAHIFTPDGPTTIDVAEQRKQKKGTNEWRQIFLWIIFLIFNLIKISKKYPELEINNL